MIKSQSDQRRPQAMTDQHDRRWSCSVEKASGMPTGIVQHEFNVPDPRLIPPQKYLVFDAGNVSKLRINYEGWLADLVEANEAWDANRIRTGHMIHGAAYNPNGPTPPELAIMLGPRPMQPDPVRAMSQGNLWALGLSDVKPPEAAKFFPDPIRADDTPVFTGPVFSQPVEPSSDPNAAMAEMLAQLDRECPEGLVGMARTNWKMKELTKRTQPQEA